MTQDLFFLVPQIVSEEKYFDVSRNEILRTLAREDCDGKFEQEVEHTTETQFGETFSVVLRLNICCKGSIPESWSISLKLCKIRIDGIDHEVRFTDSKGQKASGWHRHFWNVREQSAEKGKVPLSGFERIDSKETFLIRAFKAMNITLNAADYGTNELLQFDQT